MCPLPQGPKSEQAEKEEKGQLRFSRREFRSLKQLQTSNANALTSPEKNAFH